MRSFFVTVILMCAMLFSCGSTGGSTPAVQEDNKTPSDTMSMKSAVGDFSEYIAGRLPGNTLTAVAITNAPVQRISNYVADELTNSLLEKAGLRMVSRQDLERILADQELQNSGRFSDNSAVTIGHNLGWKTIIFGTIEPLTDAYHLALRAVDVKTGELRGSKSYMLTGSDPVLINLVNPNVSMQRITEREALLQPFDGKRNNFNLVVTTNKPVYYDNEELSITLKASEDCYFVVYHLDIENNMQIIYPNFWEKDKNILKAGVARTIPENASLVLQAPYGEERILVYASVRPFTIPEDQYKAKPVTKELLASPQALWRIESGNDGSKGVAVVPKGATAQINYTILPK